jgi:hypothetical protein
MMILRLSQKLNSNIKAGTLAALLSSIRGFMEADRQGAAYERFLAPASGSVQFAKALNRTVTASMNDMTKHAAYRLAEGDVSPFEIGSRLNNSPCRP